MLWVFNETPPSKPPVWQDIIKKGSNIAMVERVSPILLKIKFLILIVFSNTWLDRPSQLISESTDADSLWWFFFKFPPKLSLVVVFEISS